MCWILFGCLCGGGFEGVSAADLIRFAKLPASLGLHLQFGFPPLELIQLIHNQLLGSMLGSALAWACVSCVRAGLGIEKY